MNRHATAQVVELPAARVLVEADAAPAVPRMRTARGWHDHIGLSSAVFYKLHRAGKLLAYRFMSNGDPRRCPLLFAEDDVLRLIREERR